MLTLSEIFEIVCESFRSFRRRGEMMFTDYGVYDRLFPAIASDGGISDEQWQCFESEMLFFGVNYTHSDMTNAMTTLGFGSNVVAMCRDCRGIVIYPDAIALYLMNTRPDITAHEVREFVYFILSHERRHSNQSAEDIYNDYAGINSEEDMVNYGSLACERDADSWAEAQVRYMLG